MPVPGLRQGGRVARMHRDPKVANDAAEEGVNLGDEILRLQCRQYARRDGGLVRHNENGFTLQLRQCRYCPWQWCNPVVLIECDLVIFDRDQSAA